MKIIYLKNSGGHKRGDIKEVAEGYFRNLLLPQGIAVLATNENINKIKNELNKKNQESVGNLNELKKISQSLNGRKIEIRAKANESGKLYASISGDEVLRHLADSGIKTTGIKVVFQNPIKEPGHYQAKLDFGHGIFSNIKISVAI